MPSKESHLRPFVVDNKRPTIQLLQKMADLIDASLQDVALFFHDNGASVPPGALGLAESAYIVGPSTSNDGVDDMDVDDERPRPRPTDESHLPTPSLSTSPEPLESRSQVLLKTPTDPRANLPFTATSEDGEEVMDTDDDDDNAKPRSVVTPASYPSTAAVVPVSSRSAPPSSATTAPTQHTLPPHNHPAGVSSNTMPPPLPPPAAPTSSSSTRQPASGFISTPADDLRHVAQQAPQALRGPSYDSALGSSSNPPSRASLSSAQSKPFVHWQQKQRPLHPPQAPSRGAVLGPSSSTPSRSAVTSTQLKSPVHSAQPVSQPSQRTKTPSHGSAPGSLPSTRPPSTLPTQSVSLVQPASRSFQSTKAPLAKAPAPLHSVQSLPQPTPPIQPVLTTRVPQVARSSGPASTSISSVPANFSTFLPNPSPFLPSASTSTSAPPYQATSKPGLSLLQKIIQARDKARREFVTAAPGPATAVDRSSLAHPSSPTERGPEPESDSATPSKKANIRPPTPSNATQWCEVFDADMKNVCDKITGSFERNAVSTQLDLNEIMSGLSGKLMHCEQL